MNKDWVPHTTRFSLCGRWEASPESFGNRFDPLSTFPLKLRRWRGLWAARRNPKPVEGPGPKPGLRGPPARRKASCWGPLGPKHLACTANPLSWLSSWAQRRACP